MPKLVGYVNFIRKVEGFKPDDKNIIRVNTDAVRSFFKGLMDNDPNCWEYIDRVGTWAKLAEVGLGKSGDYSNMYDGRIGDIELDTLEMFIDAFWSPSSPIHPECRLTIQMQFSKDDLIDAAIRAYNNYLGIGSTARPSTINWEEVFDEASEPN